MDDLTRILNDDDEINEDLLRKYLAGDISEKEMREMEEEIRVSPFLRDAVEGLKKVPEARLNAYVAGINRNLHKYIEGKKAVKERRQIKELPFIILLVIIVLVLCILAFVMVYYVH